MSTIKNKTLAVFAVRQDVRGILAVYDDTKADDEASFFKTFDKDIKADDIVVVPAKSRLGFTTVKVTKVDVEPDFERTKEVRWIAGRVDLAAYEANVAGETALIERLNEGDRKRAREAVAAQLQETMGDDFKAIQQIELQAS